MEINYTFELDTTGFDKVKEFLGMLDPSETRIFDNTLGGTPIDNLFYLYTQMTAKGITYKLVPTTELRNALGKVEEYMSNEKMYLKNAFIKENQELFEEFKKSQKKSI